MLFASLHSVIASWPDAALYAVAAGAVVLGVLIGILINRHRGHRAIAQRLTALGARLGIEPHRDDGKVESALSYLEEVTDAATTAVGESSAESTRLRRSLDSLPLGLVLVRRAVPCALTFETPRSRDPAERVAMHRVAVVEALRQLSGEGNGNHA